MTKSTQNNTKESCQTKKYLRFELVLQVYETKWLHGLVKQASSQKIPETTKQFYSLHYETSFMHYIKKTENFNHKTEKINHKTTILGI